MPTKARGVATTIHAQAREDILNPHAIGALSAGAVSAMSAVGAAVIKKHKHAMDRNPEWFWHMFAKCEAKAARVAEQAARHQVAERDLVGIPAEERLHQVRRDVRDQHPVDQ